MNCVKYRTKIRQLVVSSPESIDDLTLWERRLLDVIIDNLNGLAAVEELWRASD